MNDTGELDDGAVLSQVRESVSRLPMATAPGLDVITARGRARRRRRAGLSVAGLAAMAASIAGAAAVLAAGPGAVTAQHGTAGRAGTVVTAYWTVHKDAAGTVTFSIWRFRDPAGLQRTLRADGVNAIIFPDPLHLHFVPDPSKVKLLPGGCTPAQANRAPLAVQKAVIEGYPEARFGRGPNGGPAGIIFTIHPGAMPPGSALVMEYSLSDSAIGTIGPVVLNNDKVPACFP